jgi:phosphatidylglycerophosphate synthase
MISRWLRVRFNRRLIGPVLFVARMKVTPAMLTVCGLGMMLIAAGAIADGHFTVAAILVLAGGILDGIDGELARVTSVASSHGAFLDSVCDHAGDAAIYFGFLSCFLAPADRVGLALTFLAMFGSLFCSQVRSRAEAVGIKLKDVGIATRFERLSVIIVGLLVNEVKIALCVVAVISTLSALQRVIYALNQVRPSSIKNLTAV